MADQAGQLEITIKEASFPSCDHSFMTPTEEIHIKKGITSFDTSRGRKQRLTSQPQCLMDQALHRSAKHAARSSKPATAPISTATIHRGPLASLSCASKRYILARG